MVRPSTACACRRSWVDMSPARPAACRATPAWRQSAGDAAVPSAPRANLNRRRGQHAAGAEPAGQQCAWWRKREADDPDRRRGDEINSEYATPVPRSVPLSRQRRAARGATQRGELGDQRAADLLRVPPSVRISAVSQAALVPGGDHGGVERQQSRQQREGNDTNSSARAT